MAIDKKLSDENEVEVFEAKMLQPRETRSTGALLHFRVATP